MKTAARQVVLVVLDGWGVAPKGRGNAIALAKKPNFDKLLKNFPSTTLLAAGSAVGLKPGEPGNSEAGHLNLGAGRLVLQEKIVITESIHDGSFFENAVLHEAAAHVRKKRSSMHLIGLLSDGQSAHSEPDHLEALLVFCKKQGLTRVYLHLFTDGRDCQPKSAAGLVRKLELLLNNLGTGRIATIGGRYYGMDRSNNWERTGLMYEAMVLGRGPQAFTAYEAVRESYRRGITDEFVLPTVVTAEDGTNIYGRDRGIQTIGVSDGVIFFNLRSDRARQMVKAFVMPRECESDTYECRNLKVMKNLHVTTLSDFGPDLLPAHPAFLPPRLVNCLPHYLGKYHGLRQLYVAEREKFAHVTYFFHGGYAAPERNEFRKRVESARVATFDEIPSMSAPAITDAALPYIAQGVYNLIVMNYANADMLGHTGQIRPTIRAIEAVDRELGRLAGEAEKAGAALLLTADHGNAEQMLDPYTGKIDTSHSANPVPFLLVSARHKGALPLRSHKSGASLRDVAPTILEILELPKPPEMSGRSLLAK